MCWGYRVHAFDPDGVDRSVTVDPLLCVVAVRHLGAQRETTGYDPFDLDFGCEGPGLGLSGLGVGCEGWVWGSKVGSEGQAALHDQGEDSEF